MQILQWLAPVAIALVFIALTSLLREPGRQKFMAVVLAGAGAVYISGGAMGVWEFPFCTLLTFAAYRGLSSYSWIGAGWLLHTAWDIVHHQLGAPIIPFDVTSSFGCAICDPVIALWCFAGAPSLFGAFERSSSKQVRAASSL